LVETVAVSMSKLLQASDQMNAFVEVDMDKAYMQQLLQELAMYFTLLTLCY
jgi:hypothetical protein